MQQPSRRRTLVRKIVRITLKTVLFLLLFVIVIGLLILTPPVQNILRKKAVAYLEHKLQTKVAVGRVYIGLPKKVVLEDIYLEDRQKDTLLSAGSVKINIDILKLIFHNKVDITSTEIKNSTAKIKRLLPDTTFNFQFVVDAFSSKDTTTGATDTTATAMSLGTVRLDNVRLVYKDVINGSDMDTWIEHLDTRIDEFDPTRGHYNIPEANIDGATARVYQVRPLASPEPEATDMIAAQTPPSLRLAFQKLNVKNFKLDYRNDVSSTFASFNVGNLAVTPKRLDLDSRVIDLQNLSLDNSSIAVRLGRNEGARVVAQQAKQEVHSQSQAGWQINVGSVGLNNNVLQFDNENVSPTNKGIDYNHLKADGFTLDVDSFVINQDSIGGRIEKGTFREKSGFQLDELRGDVLYANKQAYLKDLLLKTPGTEIRRYALLTYASYQALSKDFAKTQLDIDIENSHIQVKDILSFAPQLRSQPAFANPNAIWYLNLQGNGTVQSAFIRNLQFNGLKNTQIDASGNLATSNDPNRAGGTLTIRKLHTTQTDIALFTGRRLSNQQVNLPEDLNAHGTLSGALNNFTTNLTLTTSDGNVAVNGRLTNLMTPTLATYAATVKTNALNIGSILRNDQLTTITANVSVSGKGFTPNKLNTQFKGDVLAVGYNGYVYHNINIDGSLAGTSFTVATDIKDPNIDMNGTASGSFSSQSSFHFTGMIDSIKTLPLHLTTQPLVVRGKIDADVPVMNANSLEANVLVTKALFVSGSQRLPLDTIQFVAGKNDSSQYIM